MNPPKKFHTRTEHDALNNLLFQIEKGADSKILEIKLMGDQARGVAVCISQMQEKINQLQQDLLKTQSQLIEAQKQAIEFAKEQKITVKLEGGRF
jgi:predicted naringenin-chalcone synthase